VFLLLGLLLLGLIWYFVIHPHELEFEKVKQRIEQGSP
jgi:hypothetical protein